MILLQLSAAQGPDECALAVAKALQRLLDEAATLDVQAQVLEREEGARRGTLASVLLALDGAHADAVAGRWEGSLQWTCPSPYRPNHGRKNWFFGGARFAAPPASLEGEIRFEALRASGPGGQHVNTTDSAVRATHLASGISVKVQSERSQHANKRLAVLLIGQRLAQRTEEADGALRAERRLFHHRVERGNPVRCFRGERFEPV
ncbi:peptide chain release factor-like protein [Pseudomonas sp. Pc102]|uniref:peptide chain release factor H n=1 Tax=Pseudomonas sp. Pc102 TaxID=2678261 RepID=UPI001BCBB1E2|nr:peptide chain release factor H [Pseudomonas sp. Pc102]BBP86247.1 peptide chain release factor-like protein [Pseudomonas sp. Pc102]